MTVAELIEQLRQVPGNCYVYTYTDKQCSLTRSVAEVHEQPIGTRYVIIS